MPDNLTLREALIQQLLRTYPRASRADFEDADEARLIAMASRQRDMRHRYQAKVTLDGKRVSLGYYKTPGDAKAACDAARFAHSIGIPYNVR